MEKVRGADSASFLRTPTKRLFSRNKCTSGSLFQYSLQSIQLVIHPLSCLPASTPLLLDNGLGISKNALNLALKS